MKKIEAVENYTFKSSDQLLLDTNIWLLLYGPIPSNPRVRIYSQAFKKILEAKCQIFIDALIVSEFINRYARIQQGVIAPEIKFKAFRNSKAFKEIACSIADDTSRVLDYCRQIDSGFETIDMSNLLQEYREGDSDFNDQIVSALCSNKKLILLTDDGDFKDQSIPILTANPKLLQEI
ncbi:PIN domain-containing protein [Legionella pneumophila serogroup 1]|uniref:PIN domain-containing protein n=1 Tax=Legionella pneumophila TaxID=446 RepID=UPI00077078D0|nr:PIN domain-containing protein [Legionella pneumophila]QIB23024.1 PIN domain-containing protein [Legionella pneumophila]CZG78761.1 PIN domain [Legionella pneumophila]